MEYLVSIILALITSITAIITAVITTKSNKKVTKLESLGNDIEIVKEKINTTTLAIAELQNRTNANRVSDIKTYLTDFYTDLLNGENKSDRQKEHAYELYDEYRKNGGNSYIIRLYEELKEKKLI